MRVCFPAPGRGRHLAACLVLAGFGTTGYATADAQSIPPFQAVRTQAVASDVLVLDRQGLPLQSVRADFSQRRDDWVPLAQISPALQRAVLLSEDHRFYAHSGIDWQAVAGAAWARLTDGNLRGASTISMQLAGLLDPTLRRQAGGRSLMQKWDQAMQARVLEAEWSKTQILESYLNLAAFRGELVGIGAVSRVLFGKMPQGLDARESALVAVMLRGPNVSAHVLRQRACALLQAMQRPDQCDGLAWFIDDVMRRTAAPMAGAASQAPHLARLLLEEQSLPAGTRVFSTLDASLQQVARDSIARQMHLLRGAAVRDAAVVVLDNRSGDILAYVGSSGTWSGAAQVDHARAVRQAGSSLKPFLYALALSQERLTAASLLHDSPLSLPTGGGDYAPRNYDGGHVGWVSARTALAASLNIPAVRVLTMTGQDEFADLLRQLGIPLPKAAGHYGYSLALGSADVPLLDLTNAYRALANGGRPSPWRLRCGTAGRTACGNHAETAVGAASVLDIRPGEQGMTMAEGAAWIVGDMLSDRNARSRTFGLDSPLSTPFWTAVKTGTSKDMRDNWALGWSEHYTVGVWVGNSEGGSMRDVSGVSGAAPIWQDVMHYLHRAQGSRQPLPPHGVRRAAVHFAEGIEPDRTEVFLGDTVMREVRLIAPAQDDGGRLAAIQQPANGVILALDPDIPLRHQQLRLQIVEGVSPSQATDLRWQVNGSDVGGGGQAAWQPSPGRHRITLLDAQGNELDAVVIHVRAPAR